MRESSMFPVLALFTALLFVAVAWTGASGQNRPFPAEWPAEIGVFADRYPNEMVFCGTRDSGLILPETKLADETRVSAVCPSGTRVHFHTHPSSLLNARGLQASYWRLEFFKIRGRDPVRARDLCYLSGTDVQSLLGKYDTVAVVVTPDVYCWWSNTDMLRIQPVQRYNYPPDNQVSWGNTDG